MAASITLRSPYTSYVGATTAQMTCTASGYSLPENTSDTKTDYNATYTARTTTTTSKTYSSLTYHWTIRGVTYDRTISQWIHTQTGLTEMTRNSISWSLYVDCSVSTRVQTVSEARVPETDEEGKIIGYKWEVTGSSDNTSSGTEIVGGRSQGTVYIYTRPSGTWTWASTAASGAYIQDAITAAKQGDWVDRCTATIRWRYQNTTSYTMQASKASSGQEITSAIYNAMVSDANATGRVNLSTVSSGADILASHFSGLVGAVSF